MIDVERAKDWLSKPIGIFVFYRTALTCWAMAVLYAYPISLGNWAGPAYDLFLRASANTKLSLSFIQDWIIWPWYRWDAEWYIRIAADGYSKGASSAYPPVYPILIRILGGLLGGNLMLSALVISSTALGISCVLLYKEARLHFDTPTATRSIIYFLAFPSAFFLIGAYSESLFVLLVLLAWYFARQNQWLWALGAAILSGMTRFQGIGVFIPLLYMWLRSPKPRSRWGPALIIAPLIPLIWAIYLHFDLHLDLPWQAHTEYLFQRWSWPWTGVINNLQVLLGYQSYNTGRGTLLLDLGLTLGAIALLAIGIKYLPLEYTLLNAVLIVPALMKVNTEGLLVSMSRLVLVLWPNYLMLGILGKNKFVHWSYTGTAIVLQAVSSALYFLWFWVG
jgi:Gpi18-like mannosyltransferase